MRDDDEVGYGKTPKATRFKKGQSGNPKGRPKGSRNFKTDVIATLEAPVQLKEKGRTKTVATQQAALLRLREKALSGNDRALDRLLELARTYNDENLTEAAAAALAPSDRAILDDYLRRHGVSPPERPDGQEAVDRRPSLKRVRKRLEK